MPERIRGVLSAVPDWVADVPVPLKNPGLRGRRLIPDAARQSHLVSACSRGTRRPHMGFVCGHARAVLCS